ncbi:MAG: dihydrodipicolinate synthase family protein, partial [Oscillospiraceae bacterium]|nr:dihydrodipicolinate synthase family protein [Oscillospiraceae bacterium]
ELISALFSDVNPIPVKQAMNYMGWQVGSCRMPLCDMEDAGAIALLNVLKKYDLVK